MKTSNVFLLIAILITLGSFTAYNFKLKEFYNSGDYKNRFYGMEFTPLTGVDELHITSANLLNVSIERAEKEGIWIDDRTKPDVSLKINGQRLDLGLTDAAIKGGFTHNGIIIMTKNIRLFTAVAQINRKCDNCNTSEMELKNYQVDSLSINIPGNVLLYFHDMNVNVLNAAVGNESQRASGLTLYPDSKINTAYFNIYGNSLLDLEDPKISKVVYNVSDSASVKLNGKVLQALK